MSSAADVEMSSGSAILRSRSLLCSGMDRELAKVAVARRHTAADVNFISRQGGWIQTIER